ncbi:MAG: phosphoribosylformylglycinamidine synthase [Desulfobacterales bacterium]|nr:MAG: phosphoribosylformylglycinamidine synthase [Desulfobacterales bacterium]
MAVRLEITLKPELRDPEGHSIRKKAADYFGIALSDVRVIHTVVIDADLPADQLERVRVDLFTNPVTQYSSYDPLSLPADWHLWVGYRPGVKDNPGDVAREAMEALLGIRLKPGEAVYTSRRYCIRAGGLIRADLDLLAGELLANDIIQQWKIFSAPDWDPDLGAGIIIPGVRLDHTPSVSVITARSDADLIRISDERGLALNPRDIPVIRAYFNRPEVRAERIAVGLSDPTDIELEYISQGRSDHCNHNTFQGLFRYRESPDAPVRIIDNPFRSCIREPTLLLREKKDWIISVLWDNAGAGRFDEDHYYVITGETHNSPSNMEAYGGAITGIVGVYRDPMGTGLGARLIMGAYGFCVGDRDYDGPLSPRLHPRRLLDGVIEGVRDGGNKSGVPTSFGQLTFHPGYMGKCLVFVTALGIMPAAAAGKPSETKTTSPGELVVMCGGRVGKDGIHGVTASSGEFTEHTPAGHVQIGDPYTQKKMHDFLLEARDEGLIRFITDNGGGGLSSSVGESARFSNGVRIELDRVPLKYEGLDQWEIWISESQERMTVSVHPEDIDRFMALSRRHEVESTVIGEYTDTGKLHILWKGETCAHVDMDLLTAGFPQWEFDAVWRSPEDRGLTEPVLGLAADWNSLVRDMLDRPNICSRNWITRQYDHEVQGGSVIKPLIGPGRDIPADAVVNRPVLSSRRGLAFSQALLPFYSAIDAKHMTACVIDEALRRLVATGADPGRTGGVDNFCWPSIRHDPKTNPDGKFKAAQLVRSCEALREMSLAYEIPLLSGKDSMYVDGHLPGRYGERHKISALETLQFSAVSLVEDIDQTVTMEAKCAGDAVFVIGMTKNELGASEYYALLGYIGRNVPRVNPEETLPLYRRLHKSIKDGLIASAHGVYRGGLGVHLPLVSLGGRLGLDIGLDKIPAEDGLGLDARLFSESAGRFIVTVSPENAAGLVKALSGFPCARIGTVTEEPVIRMRDAGELFLDLSIVDALAAFTSRFGDLV